MLSVSDKQDDGSYDDADEEEYSPELYDGADDGKENKGKIISIRTLSGIDYETGLKNSGSEDTFKDLLEVYFKSVNNNYDEICGLYDKEDWKNYTIKVHALKSSSLLVGAVELSQECKELEMAGKRDDIDYIRNNHKTAMDHLKSYDEILGAFFAGPSGDETLDDTAGGSTAEETSHESGIAFDSVLIRSVYDTIREAAKENDEETISSTIMEIIELS